MVMDIREVGRFIFSGIVAALANLGVVNLAGNFFDFAIALVPGIFAGLLTSFFLTKTLAFKSKSWNRAPTEARRFLVVYVAGAGLFWIFAYLFGQYLFSKWLSNGLAETLGVLVGGMAMMISSYFGHRHYTYRGKDT